MRYLDHIQYTEVFEPTHGYNFHDDRYSVFVPANELFAYRQGELIQNAMPSLNADDREFLMTGIIPEPKGFQDLEFKKHPGFALGKAVQAMLTFGKADEFTISVVQNLNDGNGLYGHEDEGTFEIAMWHTDDGETMLPLGESDDVMPHCSAEQVDKIMARAHNGGADWVRKIFEERKAHRDELGLDGSEDSIRDPLTGAQDRDIDPQHYQDKEEFADNPEDAMIYYHFRQLLEPIFKTEEIDKFWDILGVDYKNAEEAEQELRKALGDMDQEDCHFIMNSLQEACTK